MILFLDYDGVLHPNEVYMDRKRGVVLKADGHALFEHAELLVNALEPHPYVRIVLSTSWVWAVGFNKAKACLPERLQILIKGATWHSTYDKYEWDRMTRYEQIQRYVMFHRLTDWLAIDDNDLGWPDDKRHHLVHTDEWIGLGDKVIQDALAVKLTKGKT